MLDPLPSLRYPPLPLSSIFDHQVISDIQCNLELPERVHLLPLSVPRLGHLLHEDSGSS